MKRWTTATCQVNGIQIHYLRTGGDNPPLILLHGLMTSGACWTPCARHLEKDYDVIMPDARGHGSTTAPIHGYTYNHLADEVIGFIHALQLPTPILVGHSMGGMTATLVASQIPDRLKAIALIDPTFLTPELQEQVLKQDLVAQHRQLLKRPQEEVLAERVQRSGRSHELLALLVKARFQTSLHAFEILTPPFPDYSSLMRALDLPGLLVIGDTDSVVSPKVAAELTEQNSRFKVVQIKEAGHGIPFDQPKQLSATVKGWLDSLRYST